jgi:PAS domain S-box-containing protein
VPLPTRALRLACCFLGAAAVKAAEAPLRVGIDLDGEPMTLLDRRGAPAGFAVDLLNAIAENMHFEVVFVAKPWAEMLQDFRDGRTDLLANITSTTERGTFIEFSDPHTVMTGAIFVRKGDHAVHTPADLRDRRVAVKIGGAPHSYLVEHGWARHIVPASTLRDSLRLVAENRADAALDARIIGLKNLRDEGITNVTVADVALPDFAQRLHFGAHRGDTARIALLNEGLARLRANGTYDRIYEKWLAPLEPRRVRWRELQPYLIPAAVFLAMAIGGLIWQRSLLRRLASQAEELRLSEERLRLVMEGTEDGFWDWDMRTGRIERSERWAAMLGYSLAEIPPTLEAGTDLVHPDDRQAYADFRNRLKADVRGDFGIEYRMRAKSGEWRWILDRGKVVARSADGTPLRMTGTHTDITDLKRAREEAARQQARFRFIYEHSPVGISWVQPHEEASRLVNPAHERITGVSIARSRDTANYVAATHPDDRALQQELEQKLYRGEIDHFSMEKRYVHADGAIVWAMLTMHLFRDPVTGEAQEVTTLVDLNDLKRAEAEREKLSLKMLETQKLESLGVLAGGIAHDFNNLLTVILANATFIRAEGSADQRIEHIEAAARRAADLCRQMLAYAGKGNFVVEQVDLGSLVEDTAHLLHVSISKKARLSLSLAPQLPAVEGDPSQLRQVIMNLVINASEALADSPGEIRIATRLGRPVTGSDGVTHSFDLPPTDCVCVEIADSGEGMSGATLNRIFDPFFTTKFAGRGLGLAAVLGIVRVHRGALTVQSTPGQGTTFRLFLPASKVVTPGAKSEPPFPPRPGTGGTILIADDEPAVLATADAVLQHHGYRTVLASDGTQAVQRFRENPQGFASVLLDLTMPGLDGAEVLRIIRAERPATPVLVMSGFSEADVVNRLRGLGQVTILRKPFTQDLLLSRIAEAAAMSAPAARGHALRA